MNFEIKVCNPICKTRNDLISEDSDCVVVGIFEDGELEGPAMIIDAASGGLISRLLAEGDFNAKLCVTTMLYTVPGLKSRRVLLVGLGNRNNFNAKHYADASRAAFKSIKCIDLYRILYTLSENPPIGRDTVWAVREAVLAVGYASYLFNQIKDVSEISKGHTKSIILTVKEEILEKCEVIDQSKTLAKAINLTRDLANLPSNICTPIYLAEVASKMANDLNLKADILSQKEIEEVGMTSFLSVSKGSTQPPRFIVLHYNGNREIALPIVLIGKGITFDSGGISIKPSDSMEEMKYDMCGAASVLGTLYAVAAMRLPINVIVVVPACENMPSGNALKPGDIIRTMSGKTVEIINTDAEGRLILCDALTYVKRFNPSTVIDVATLTGACLIALGHYNTGLFSNSDALANELLAAGEHAVDPCWRLPIHEVYQEQLKSNFADLTNVGGKAAGSVTAACFLSNFIEDYNWAHLDIAGTAWKNAPEKEATGRPVSLLTEFLFNVAHKNRIIHST